jgi:hypothetical protein
MAASDPTTDVPTPTGTLQGVAAFSWDGSAWQPSGRAGPSVATPTGVLRGVAQFNGGPAWQPSGRAQPGVATPSGTLDSVAVYTWSGSAWTPPGGQPAPSTPSGALRGVAAFNWDGAAWQPAGQAGPSVATPYGVLDGVAMFNWSGSAWAAVGAPSLSLDFMTPGTLDPRITFTRASAATYFNSAGVMQTAATNAPRWDYDPATHVLRGLLIEEARTNLALRSGDMSNAVWGTSGSGAPPTITGNQAVAPDGTTTAASVLMATVTGGGYAIAYQGVTVTAAVYTYSIWLRGAVGGEQLYINLSASGTFYTSPRLTLTTQWQRFSVTSAALTATTWYAVFGCDTRDASESGTPAQTIFVWGAQVEQGAFATSYISTIAAVVTRTQEVCGISPGNMGFYVSPGGSWQLELIASAAGTAGNTTGVGQLGVGGAGAAVPLYLDPTLHLSQYDGAVNMTGTNTGTIGVVTKAATSLGAATGKTCLNGGSISSTGGFTNGYPALATSGVGFLAPYTAGDAQNTKVGYIRRVRYWPRVLSDAELQAVTT